MTTNWYCVETHYGQERVALLNLKRQRFESLLPLMLEEKQTKSGRAIVEVPLFQSYVFARFDIDVDTWRPVRNTIGVKRLVSFTSDIPSIVPLVEMERIIALSRALTTPVVVAEKVFVPECKVRVLRGPLAAKLGHEPTTGICQWAKGRRVELLMGMMNGEIAVEFDIDDVEPVT